MGGRGLGKSGETRRTTADIVSANYFSVLGVAPAFGRAFLSEEERPGRAERVAVVSHSYWQKQGSDPGLLGRSITINGRPFTIVGIMPKGFLLAKVVVALARWLSLGPISQIVRFDHPEWSCDAHQRT